MWSVSAAAATYYLYTPITGANTTFSSAVSSVWQFNVTNSFDFGGGSFTIKKNGSANRDDARFSLCTTLPANYSGGEPCTGANLVATTSIPYTSVPQSYTLTPIRFATPITLSSGRTYYGVLWSATGSIGSKQYFVKGANSTFIADSTQTPIPSGYVSINNSAPQFNISKAASSSSVTTGSTITYTFTITNQGNLTAGAGSTITVADKLPSNVTYVTRSETAITGLDSSGSTAPSCVFDSTVGSTTYGSLICTVTLSANLAVGSGSAKFSIQATATSAGSAVNYASVDPAEDRFANVVSTNANWHPEGSIWLNGRLAAKTVSESLAGVQSDYQAGLVSGRIIKDLNKDFDVGLQGSMMYSPQGNTKQYALGAEVGYLMQQNTWVSVGYNFTGFSDRDLTGSDYTARGTYVRLRMKFDEKNLVPVFKKMQLQEN